jgi:hypothetical protein
LSEFAILTPTGGVGLIHELGRRMMKWAEKCTSIGCDKSLADREGQIGLM